LRLRLPTPGLVGSPLVHSSCLVPVSFVGFLIKCLRVHWQSLPQCRFAWPFSRRVGFSSRGSRVAIPCVPSATLSFFYVCRAFAVRRGYPSLFGPYLPVGCRSLHSPCGFFVPPPPPNISLASLAPVFSLLPPSFGLFFVLTVVFVRLPSSPPVSLAVAAVPLGIFSDLRVSPPCMLPISWCL
jgi:hypothetical protein